MELNDFLNNEEPKALTIKAEEGQLILGKKIQEDLITFQKVRKEVDKLEKEIKNHIQETMKRYGITKYESNDKKLMITLGEDSTTETIDKDKLFLKYPDVYRDEEIVKESKRKGSLRITIRESEENDK